MIVLDASAAVDAVIGHDAGGWVRDHVADETVCAPAHQPAEVLSGIARLLRAGEITVDAADLAMADLAVSGQELVPSTLARLRRALALHDRIRVLDGLYVALAEERGCALVTTDRRLARAQLPCEVRAPDG